MTKKTIHTEKELILSRKLNKKIKTIENKINSISIIKNEKNLDIAKLELERIKNLIPIQYK